MLSKSIFFDFDTKSLRITSKHLDLAVTHSNTGTSYCHVSFRRVGVGDGDGASESKV